MTKEEAQKAIQEREEWNEPYVQMYMESRKKTKLKDILAHMNRPDSIFNSLKKQWLVVSK